jgi:hypothetical protein
MNLRTVGIATVVFALSALTDAAEGQNTDPRSVLKRYIEAQNAGELDAALALWADDGAIINTKGTQGRRQGKSQEIHPDKHLAQNKAGT